MTRHESFTVNRLPDSHNGVVAYCWRTGKISVSDTKSQHYNIAVAIDGLLRRAATNEGKG